MVYKQKNPLGPTFLALALVVGGACAFTAAATRAPLPSIAAGITATPGANLTASINGFAVAPNSSEAALLMNIQEIQGINLNTSVLDDASFASFTDFIRFSSQPAGRSNPFAPFAGFTASSSSL